MRTRSLLCTLAAALGGLLFTATADAANVSFGSGLNQFSMEFVEIGSPGNAPNTTGLPNPAGAVNYSYYMGKFEVSRDMIIKANTVGGLGVTMADLTAFGGNGANKPATGISWNEAARFVNWLNTSQGFAPAYKFTTNGVNDNIALWTISDPGYNTANPFRNSQANYFLPSVDEWYKAAYYKPNGGSGMYTYFPTGGDTIPTQVTGGTAPGTAVYGQQIPQMGSPADVNNAGGLSSFGVMAMGGNAYEWEETEYDLVNNSPSSARDYRGGSWINISANLMSLSRTSGDPKSEQFEVGFRVASLTAIPEPSTYALLITGLTVLGWSQWRRKGC